MLECACKTCLPIKILEQNEGNVCGRLLVIVVEAENLQASSATGKNYIRLRFELGKRMNKTHASFATRTSSTCQFFH